MSAFSHRYLLVPHIIMPLSIPKVSVLTLCYILLIRNKLTEDRLESYRTQCSEVLEKQQEEVVTHLGRRRLKIEVIDGRLDTL